MDDEFVPISEVTSPPESFQTAISELKSRIDDNDIPNWLLVPGRAAGEYATGNEWFGIVMSKCSTGAVNEQSTATINARIAWDTEDRHRSKSTPSDVPEVILDVVESTSEKVIGEVDMCVVKIEYDVKTMAVEDVTVGHHVNVVGVDEEEKSR